MTACTVVDVGDLLCVGPRDDQLPAWFSAGFNAQGVGVEIRCSFDNVRVRLNEVTFHGDDLPVRAIVGVRVGELVSAAAREVLVRADYQPVPFVKSRQPTSLELRTLAAVYAVEHAVWGSPRLAVMERYRLPRSTADYWIRQARDIYGLPGGPETAAA